MLIITEMLSINDDNDDTDNSDVIGILKSY